MMRWIGVKMRAVRRKETKGKEEKRIGTKVKLTVLRRQEGRKRVSGEMRNKQEW